MVPEAEDPYDTSPDPGTCGGVDERVNGRVDPHDVVDGVPQQPAEFDLVNDEQELHDVIGDPANGERAHDKCQCDGGLAVFFVDPSGVPRCWVGRGTVRIHVGRGL